MNIKTKYNIGDRIWVVYQKYDVVCVYDDFIAWITYDEDGINYGLKECCDDIRENRVILYEETDKLVEKIKQIMQEIREKEGNEDE